LRTNFSPGRLPPVRFSGRAVIAGKRNTSPIFRGGGFTCVSRGADYAVYGWQDENQGGHSTPRCGGVLAGEAGSRPTVKRNANTDVCVSFFLSGFSGGGGGGWIMEAAKTLPPEYAYREGCAALGGHSTLSSQGVLYGWFLYWGQDVLF
jgi:hypothetical protein